MVRPLSSASLALVAGLLTVPGAAQPAMDFTIEPGLRAGPVSRDMTEARLNALLPKGQVRRRLNDVGEGSVECGTEIFAGTSNAAFISWGTMTKVYDESTPKTARICQNLPPPSKPHAITLVKGSEQSGTSSAWRTTNGIRLGMTIRELEAVLGEPFEFSVCPCDFGGAIQNTGGERKALQGIAVLIDFPPDTEETLKASIRVEDDYALKSSDVPADRVGSFVVSKIIVSLGD